MRSSAARCVYGALALRPGGSGVQTYIREYLREVPALLPDTEIAAVVQRDAVDDLPGEVRPVTRPVSSGAVRAVLGSFPTFSCQAFHALDVDLPVATHAFTIATVHDLSVFDMPSASTRFRAAGERRLVSHALRKADLLLAVSQFTAERIKAISGRDSTVVELAPACWARPPEARQVAAVRAKYGLPERFVLQVGTVEPRKDVALVAEAAAALDVPCVLAGAGSTGPAAPRKAIGLGYVDVEDLPALYHMATITAYASKYEGFGLPPVEAMACGAAVVASAVGALPQVVGDGAVLAKSSQLSDWVAAMRPLLCDSAARNDLRAKALQTAATMTWHRTTELSIKACRDAGAPL
jgi:glycosyltransferase involved in cell wall biosynthesis